MKINQGWMRPLVKPTPESSGISVFSAGADAVMLIPVKTSSAVKFESLITGIIVFILFIEGVKAT